MKILVKIGGAQLEHPDARSRFCAAVAAACRAGHEVLLVHGGGNQIRSVSESMGLESRYHEGLRITDEATAEVALMVLGGLVNKRLVQSLTANGTAAVGLTGADGGTFSAKKLTRAGVDLGFVGAVDQIDPSLVQTLLAAGTVPVLATVAPPTQHGGCEPFFNINADHAAGPLGYAFGCDVLLFLTDVPGVRNAKSETMPMMNDADCERLIASGVAKGGMQPKIEAAQLAARANPQAIVKIASAKGADCVLAALRDGAGTRFFSRRPVNAPVNANDDPQSEPVA
ncbi:MAG: acetylglutamate kinase [Planctomycetota bacterium]